MQLLYSERSPYARKCRAVAIEKGLKLELVEVMPLERPESLLKVNPLGKIPVLLLDDGSALSDSRVIAEYLDHIGGGPKLIPEGPPKKRFNILTLAALAEGILDSAVACTLESMRPEALRHQPWLNKHSENIAGATMLIERDYIADLKGDITIAAIATACALDYVENRLPDIGVTVEWRKSGPELALWFEDFKKRPSIAQTAPASWQRATAA